MVYTDCHINFTQRWYFWLRHKTRSPTGGEIMNTLLRRVHQIDTLAFLWLHVTKGSRYRHSVRWISRTGDGPLYLLVAVTLFLFEPVHGKSFLLAGLTAYAFDVSLYWL